MANLLYNLELTSDELLVLAGLLGYLDGLPDTARFLTPQEKAADLALKSALDKVQRLVTGR